MFRRFVISAAAAGVLVASGQAQQTPSLGDLKTTAEASDYKSTSTYEDVVRFMKAVDAASPLVYYTTYGKTYEGRDMPMAVVGTGLKDASPASVLATNRLRVHIQGNIHAGEVEGKEAALILLREFAQNRHADWLGSMVFLITPIFNADGNEKFALTNRGRQNGPINGMGTRQQGQGLNINRDFMKLDTPEGRAFVKLWNDYDPQVGFDLHTSDGSATAYYLTYAPPLNPNTSPLIMSIMKDEWFPFVTKNIKAKHGWDTFYYGNASTPGGRRGRGAAQAPGAAAAAGRAAGAGAGSGRAGGQAGAGRAGGAQGRGQVATPTPTTVGQAPAAGAGPRAWSTFEHVPRFHNNYVGMRNRFALLSEAYAYATFEDRIKATYYFMEEGLNFANENADRLKKAVADADKEDIIGTAAGTRAQMKRGGMADILMGEVEDELNPNTQRMMSRRKDVVRTESMIDMMWFEPAATEDVAREYYIPAGAEKALELLRAHGIQVRQLTQPVSGVEEFAITANTQAPVRNGSSDFGAHGLRTLKGDWQAASGVTVPAGSYAVAMNQKLARLAFYLVAPTSDDGLATWNFLDELLGADVTVYPILRKK